MTTVKIDQDTNERLEAFLDKHPQLKKQGLLSLAIDRYLDEAETAGIQFGGEG